MLNLLEILCFETLLKENKGNFYTELSQLLILATRSQTKIQHQTF